MASPPPLEPARPGPLAITLFAGLALWLSPPPAGVDPRAWHLLALFAATILGIILKPLPMGAVALAGLLTAALTGVLSIDDALGAFDNKTIWLIVLAFFISRGFIKTGLGARIGYLLIRALGRRTLGLAYGLAATDLILAPAMPSNTARSGGVVYPLARAVALAFGSRPEDGTAGRIGAFLILTSFQATCITSAMFLTAMAANPLAQKLAADAGITVTWVNWAWAGCVPGLVSLAVVPLVLYRLEPPAVKETPAATEFAQSKLSELGPVKSAEWVMLGAFALLLTLWVFGDWLGIDVTTAALAGLVLLLLSGALTWDDVLRERGAWDTLVWFSALVGMAEGLNRLGLIPWFSQTISASFAGTPWTVAFPLLVLVYFFSHYLFASNTAHVSAMYASLLGVAVATGAPPLLAALVLGFVSNLYGGLTHYSTGPAPVLFGSGYVPVRRWWTLGLIAGVVNLMIWGVIGGLWWRLIGLW